MTESVAEPRTWLQQKRDLVSIVGSRAAVLQRGYLNEEADAIAMLARLRRAVNVEPGADPDVWEITVLDIADFPAPSDDTKPSAAEWAAHGAMTLFAFHQQSQRDLGMHLRGAQFGAAIGRLARGADNSETVRTRFVRAGTASDLPMLLVHLRALVGQLRSKKIRFDYGELAGDLFRWQFPNQAPSVRLSWGRAYHSVRPSDTEEKPDPSEETP